MTDKRKGPFEWITRKPNSFRRGPSTRHARKLRRMVTSTINSQKALAEARLVRLQRHAERKVQDLSYELRPERTLELQEELAYWVAARDSLEDDGVLPDRKTFNA